MASPRRVNVLAACTESRAAFALKKNMNALEIVVGVATKSGSAPEHSEVGAVVGGGEEGGVVVVARDVDDLCRGR